MMNNHALRRSGIPLPVLIKCAKRSMIIPRKTKIYGSFFNPNSNDRSASMLPSNVLKQAHAKNQVALAEPSEVNLYDTFEENCIPKAVRDLIATHFGAVAPTDIQRRTLPFLLRRDSVALSAQSGTGKTLSYLLPMYMNMQKDRDVYKIPLRKVRPRAILLLPTQELCVQLQRDCAVFNEKMCFHSVVYRGKSRAKRSWARMSRRNRLLMDVLITTPTALRTQIESRRLFLDDLRYAVLDEADTLISAKHEYTANAILARIRDRNLYQWLWPVQTQYVFVSCVVTSELNKTLQNGFPQVRRIAAAGLHKSPSSMMHRFLPVRRESHKFDILCYLMKRSGYLQNTGNAPIARARDFAQMSAEECDALVSTSEKQGEKSLAISNTNSSNSSQNTKQKPMVRRSGTKRVLIFFSEIEACTAIFYKLQARGFPAAQLHSMLPLDERRKIYNLWADGKIPILCTTDLLSIGIDNDIDVVINFTMPNQAVTYLRRAGRTARMGSRGLVVSLYTKAQRTIVRAMRETILKNKPMNDLSNWWQQYKPTYLEWKKRKRNAVTKKFIHLILRRTVPQHLEKTYVRKRGTLELPWHPKTIQYHGGIPERKHTRVEHIRHQVAHEARKGVLARRKKGSAKFGRRKGGAFTKSFKGVDTGYGGDAQRVSNMRSRDVPSATEHY